MFTIVLIVIVAALAAVIWYNRAAITSKWSRIGDGDYWN